MNDAAKKWVEELRSGKWQQARKTLREKDSFCCLGVANEISGIGAWNDSSYCENDFDDNGYEIEEEEFASPAVAAQLGLKTKDGGLVINGVKTSLADLNDSGLSFADIADIIEKHADQLFVSTRSVAESAVR